VRLPFFYGWIVVAVTLRDHGYRGTGLGRRGGARALHDRTGSYVLAFWIAIAASVVSAVAMWLAAPRKVWLVSGRVGHGRRAAAISATRR